MRRRDREIQRQAMEEEESLFPDIAAEIEVDSNSATELEVRAITKSPLYLLLMVRAERFPLVENQTLYINTKTGSDKPIGTMRINRSAKIVTSDGTFDSLAAAAKKFQPWTRKKSRWPDGWEAIRVLTNHGKYISLNRLFLKNWDKLDVPFPILQDEEALSKHMVEKDIATATEVEGYMLNPRQQTEEKDEQS